MSASISPSEALAAIRRGEKLPSDVVHRLGEEQPTDFFRVIVESLADSFDPAEVAAYEELMQAWIEPPPAVKAVIPNQVDTVYVLSRVTLGADVKIVSPILDAMMTRFPDARVVLVSTRKSAELFAKDRRVEYLNADYPRSGPVSARVEFARQLQRQVESLNSIVIDPDSRMTQLGLIPVCAPERYFHFATRTSTGDENLSYLTTQWLRQRFGVTGEAWIAAEPVRITDERPRTAISFGVGENESKRIAGDFEARVIELLARKYSTIWIDRGVGGEEARRVTDAVAASGAAEQVRFWEGSFAGFASVISQCDFYAGYDSAGQHVAAACKVPLVTFFRGAASARFRQRWSPSGSGPIHVINADLLAPDECLAQFSALLK